MPRLLRFLVLGTASVGFLSYAPYRIVPFKKFKGGGLLGSLAGLGLVLASPSQGPVLWLLTALIVALSVAASHWAEKLMGSLDDPRIIVDEVAGVWIAALGLPRTFWPMLGALVFFRIFDVIKGPWGRWASRAPGGFGVVADDLLAGLIANGCVRAIF